MRMPGNCDGSQSRSCGFTYTDPFGVGWCSSVFARHLSICSGVSWIPMLTSSFEESENPVANRV